MIVDASVFQVLCGDYACTADESAGATQAEAPLPPADAVPGADATLTPARAGPSGAPAP